MRFQSSELEVRCQSNEYSYASLKSGELKLDSQSGDLGLNRISLKLGQFGYIYIVLVPSSA